MTSPVFGADVDAVPTKTEEGYERATLEWVKRRVADGIAMLRREKAYNDCQKNMDALMGDQIGMKQTALSGVVDNKLKKIVLETASALTNIRPIWSYQTNRDEYKAQSDILNKLARAWWKSSLAERKMVNAIIYSCVGGSGYVTLTWNGTDLVLTPVDPRDVIPIDPVYSDSIQDWRGIAVRQKVPLETLLSQYPTKRGQLHLTRNSWFGPDPTRGNRLYDVVTTVFSIVSSRAREGGSKDIEGVDLIRVWVKDETIHTGDAPRVMGDPTKGEAYTVYPVGSINPNTLQVVTKEEAKLYPRGRLIICTPECILEDMPNPYWHGMFPVVRFTLDPMPWTLLGAALVTDLMPLQTGLNEALRGIEDGIQQWIRRGVIADKNAIAPQNLKAIDTRKAGLQALVNPSAGEGFKIIEGPQLPEWYLKSLEFYKGEMEENSGVRGLQQLTQLKQMPSADTVEKFIDALSPLLQLRAHSIEHTLSEMAEMLKVSFFQFYTMERRFQILGPKGLALEDFDYDPETLVPAEVLGVAPEADRETRAKIHHRNFVFSIAPDSLLNISHAMQKMLILQLLRSNIIDPYSVWDAMNLTDTGPIPAETIPERIFEARRNGLLPGPPPEIIQAQNMMTMAQAQMALGGMAMGMMGPGAPPPAGQLRAPSTSGIGPEGGRPPSGGQSPELIQKEGGARTVVSESGR